MGITGLLPILKPIQTQRHLSEFLGQTLAVDAYVWLHRGVYACATDLAMGRKTTKYVEYAMHRIRLLLHHKIQPFVVFDGGPLPAKAPTETSRKKRREDSLALGQELAKRGKRKEAREHFIKSIDVGTEMAFQLIKALKAEGIPYIVAPYEADAQLAYLERLGVVDGIITEDSDLLVFGCKKVLFKLDAVSQTVTCISQSDFASVDGSNGGGISLQTFTPSQFRHMCMLSGCDYLPSIPGIGLRTAYALLRTHKSMENVVRAVRLEGKKSVPKDYTKMFRLAEKAFSHQRVWDPFQEKLVYLTDPEGEELDEEADSYVGCDLPQALAKQIAEGDVCPITRQPMKDINPDYMPSASKRAPLVSTSLNRSNNKGIKGEHNPSTGRDKGLLDYFALKSKDAPVPRKKLPSDAKSGTVIVGRASGKRTLVEVMDLEMEGNRKKARDDDFISDISSTETRISSNQSRFFGRSASGGWPPEGAAVAGTSRLAHYKGEQKENLHILVEDEERGSDGELSAAEECDDAEEEVQEASNVAQEDGYLSPTHSIRWDTPDLSSPTKLSPAGKKKNEAEDDFFGADAISSPITGRRSHSMPRPEGGSSQDVTTLKRTLSLRSSDSEGAVFEGVDLRDAFGDDEDILTSDAEAEEVCPENSFSSTTSASTAGPVTPDDSGVLLLEGDDIQLDFGYDTEEQAEQQVRIRQEVVASGWRQKWACATASGKSMGKQRATTGLRRAETTITPDGKTVRGRKIKTSSTRESRMVPKAEATISTSRNNRTGLPSRNSLTFQEMRRAPAPDFDSPATPGRPGSDMPLDDVISRARGRLAQFRLATKDACPHP